MKKIHFLLLFILLPFLGRAQDVKVVNFDQLEQIWEEANDTLYLINFWATWCQPCVEELPYFMQVNEEMKNEKFKMILVSLDFPRQIESRVIPFLEKHNISDANVWINRVNKDWDGAIPASLFIKNEKKAFYDHALNYEELKKITQDF